MLVIRLVKLIGVDKLDEYGMRHAVIEGRLSEWRLEVLDAKWTKPDDIRSRYPNASALKKNRFVFRMGRNHRLIAAINYRSQVVSVRFIGTHSDYERIDAEQI